MILIITCSFDKTADYIESKLNKESFRLNTDEIHLYKLAINHFGWAISKNKAKVTSEEIRAVYYRKPYLPNVDEYDPLYKDMIINDNIYIIMGLVAKLNCAKLTCPYILKKAENKLYQLKLAKQAGFNVPLTLYTNSKEDANVFINERKTVIKPISTGKVASENKCEIYNTSILRSINDEIAMTPIFLQEYLKKDYEARVYFVKEVEFFIKIIAKNKVDWRLDEEENIYSLCRLPREIRKKCLEYMKLSKLRFGAFDFIIKDGQWWFLEVNPNGQWLWLEEHLNLTISDEIIKYLEG